jgi:hypothetical protein
MEKGERNERNWEGGGNERNWEGRNDPEGPMERSRTSSAERGANFGITPMEHFTV